MKLKTALGTIFVLSGSIIFCAPLWADANANATKLAEAAMMKACMKEFPAIVSGKSVVDLDHWAEASENQAGSVVFKKSHCYQTHEAWEKLAQKNEWSPGSQARIPANAGPSK